jgi:hypothetical protein
MSIEEMLRKNAPKTPDVPKNELSLLLNKIEQKKETVDQPRFRFKRIQWMSAVAAGVVIALGVPWMKQDIQQQGVSGEESAELVSFAADTFVETLETDTYVAGGPIEQVSVFGDEIEI